MRDGIRFLTAAVLCVSLQVGLQGNTFAQPPSGDEIGGRESEWAERRAEMERHRQEWEQEQNRRRAEEGEYFDEKGYEFEKGQMEDRWALDEERLNLEQEFDLRHREIDAKYRAIDEAGHAYWQQKQRGDQQRHKQEWEDEQDRRRQEEGEHFDEATYEFEKGQMEARWELDEERMALDDKFHQEMNKLNEAGLDGPEYERAWEELESRHGEDMSRVDDRYREIDEAGQAFWQERQRGDMERHKQEWEEEQERRREEEGEHFDEEAYEFEKGQMESRWSLDEERMRMDNKFHADMNALNDRGLEGPAYDSAWQALEESHQRGMDRIDDRYRDIDEAGQAYWQNRQRADVERQKQEWEEEQEGRREEEGEHFDEEAYEFEKGQMESRWSLDEERMRMDSKFHAEMNALNDRGLEGPAYDRAWQALEEGHQRDMERIDDRYSQIDEAGEEFWTNRMAADADNVRDDIQGHFDEMQGFRDEFEEAASHRREEVGDDFDESMYEFESGQWDRRLELAQRRMEIELDRLDLEEVQHSQIMAVEERGLPDRVRDRAVANLERKFERQRRQLEQEFEEIDEEFQRIDEESQARWEEFHQEEERRAEDSDSGWPPGPNAIRLVVESADGGEVKVRIEIADSDPIVGWTLQVNYDSDALEFSRFEKGDFIAGFFSPGNIVNDEGVELGGATLQQANAAEGDGVLGYVIFDVAGELPTWVSLSGLDLQGDVTREINLDSEPLDIGR